MVIGSQDKTSLPALKMIRLLADEARRELGSNADRGTTARPTVAQLNNTLERLASIVKLMDEVVLPVLDLPDLNNASDIERRIVKRLVTDLLAAGYKLGVNDGEERTITHSTDPDAIYKALASTDSDTLIVHYANGHEAGVLLIWGNEQDIISDYHTVLEPELEPITDWIIETWG